MTSFYKKVITVFIVLVVINGLSILGVLKLLHVRHALLPMQDSRLPWNFTTITDQQKGGRSTVAVNDASSSLNYDYVITEDVQYPHVTAVVAFDALQNAQQFADLSGYSTLNFTVSCFPSNFLALHLHTYDPIVTDRKNFSSYRISEALFACDKQPTDVEIDLQHMRVATWWLENFGVVISDQQYWLDKVVAMSIGASLLGPVNQPANVKIEDLSLNTNRWLFIWFAGGLSLLLWVGYFVWLIKCYTQSLIMSLKQKMLADRQLTAYRQLALEPHKNREKNQVLKYLAVEYSNPDLNLEMAIHALGINRTKMNEILKGELGLTFNAYVNKLRLAEAAHLLSGSNKVRVNEVAYKVGYNDASYFNKLFKDKYGCTPKAFKNIYHSDASINPADK